MPGYFERTVSAICYDLADLLGGPPASSCHAHNDVVRFVLGQINRMPEFLALGIRIATIGFGVSRLPTEFSFFHQRDAARRKAQLEAWMRSRIGPCQDLMKFYTSLVTLVVYSRPESDRSRERGC